MRKITAKDLTEALRPHLTGTPMEAILTGELVTGKDGNVPERVAKNLCEVLELGIKILRSPAPNDCTEVADKVQGAVDELKAMIVEQ